jgi:hypothetical protein
MPLQVADISFLPLDGMALEGSHDRDARERSAFRPPDHDIRGNDAGEKSEADDAEAEVLHGEA